MTVDLREMKAPLVRHARELRLSVSRVVRDAVARALPDASATVQLDKGLSAAGSLTKLSLRLTADEADRLRENARKSGLSQAAFVAGLNAGAEVIPAEERQAARSALIASNAGLADVGRWMRQVASLLAQGRFAAAQAYAARLDARADDVRQHLLLSGAVLRQLGRQRTTHPERRLP